MRLTRPDMTPEEAARHERFGVPHQVDLSDDGLASARIASEERDREAVERATAAYLAAVNGWIVGCDEREYPAARAAWEREARKFPPEAHMLDGLPAPMEPASLASAPAEVRARAADMCAAIERRDVTGLWLHGPVGTGKTTLARLVLGCWRLDGWDGDAVTEGGFLSAVRAEFDGAAPRGSTLDRYGHAALLVLDDVGKERPTEWSVSQLYGLVDARWSASLPTVVTSNEDPGGLRDRLSAAGGETADAIVSRLAGMCRVLRVGGADHRQDWRRAS